MGRLRQAMHALRHPAVFHLRRGAYELAERYAALHQYAICRRILADELGAAPSRRTTALYEAIRAETVQGASAAMSPMPGDEFGH